MFIVDIIVKLEINKTYKNIFMRLFVFRMTINTESDQGTIWS